MELRKRVGIRQDGSNYVFTPGKGGSLMARKLNPTPNPLSVNTPYKKTAKSLPKKFQGIVTALGSKMRGEQ